jgi:hypothetical protein
VLAAGGWLAPAGVGVAAPPEQALTAMASAARVLSTRNFVFMSWLVSSN